MENFKVNKNDIVVNACTHRYRRLSHATVITNQDFPNARFNFKDFGEVLVVSIFFTILFDI